MLPLGLLVIHTSTGILRSWFGRVAADAAGRRTHTLSRICLSLLRYNVHQVRQLARLRLFYSDFQTDGAFLVFSVLVVGVVSLKYSSHFSGYRRLDSFLTVISDFLSPSPRLFTPSTEHERNLQ